MVAMLRWRIRGQIRQKKSNPRRCFSLFARRTHEKGWRLMPKTAVLCERVYIRARVRGLRAPEVDGKNGTEGVAPWAFERMFISRPLMMFVRSREIEFLLLVYFFRFFFLFPKSCPVD